jgi:hypothetical protein
MKDEFGLANRLVVPLKFALAEDVINEGWNSRQRQCISDNLGEPLWIYFWDETYMVCSDQVRKDALK